jgi:hypothetical protein
LVGTRRYLGTLRQSRRASATPDCLAKAEGLRLPDETDLKFHQHLTKSVFKE